MGRNYEKGRPRPRLIIASLAEAINNGKTLSWYVKFGQAGDPLPHAWRACQDKIAMTALLFAIRVMPPLGACAHQSMSLCRVCLRAAVPAMSIHTVMERIGAQG